MNCLQASEHFECRYSKEWEKTVKRIGRWIDFENDYKTLDPSFMESVWWVFSTLHKKGLVYQGFKVCTVEALASSQSKTHASVKGVHASRLTACTMTSNKLATSRA